MRIIYKIITTICTHTYEYMCIYANFHTSRIRKRKNYPFLPRMRQIWKIPKQMKHRINNYESALKATKITKWKGHKKELTVVFALSFLFLRYLFLIVCFFFRCPRT